MFLVILGYYEVLNTEKYTAQCKFYKYYILLSKSLVYLII